MMSIMDKLNKPHLIRLQLFSYLYLTRSFNTFRDSCNFIYKNALNLSHTQLHQVNQKLELKKQDPEDENILNIRKNLFGQQIKPKTGEEELSIYSDTGCPYELHPICTWYSHVTTVILIIIAAKNILPIKTFISYWNPELPAHCYIPGRFILHTAMTDLLEILFAVWHISWRVSSNRARSLNLSMFVFMLQDELKLAKFYKRICWDSDYEASIPDEDNVHNLYLRSIFCYPVRYKSRIIYRLRPSQRPAARVILQEEIIKCTLVTVAMFFTLVIIVGPLVSFAIIADRAYVKRYPNCDPYLDQLANQGKLEFWSFTLRGHHLVMIFFDYVENLVLWVESGFIMSFCLALAYLLNCNLLIHWKKVQAKLNQLDQILKLDRFYGLTSQRSQPDMYVSRRKAKAHLRILPMEQLDLTIEHSTGECESETAYRIHHLENLTIEIQAEICDFFFQIHATDVCVSDVMSFGVVLWFMLFEVIAYTASLAKDVGIGLTLVGVLGFLLFTVVSMYLLTLQQATCKMYNTICSIMAYDRTVYKRKYIKILEFYHVRNRSCYTLFHQFPYTATTYLTVIGWTLSCAIISENLWTAVRAS